jgi:hypothetical protein
MTLPLTAINGVQLTETSTGGISKVRVMDESARKDLSWDRYVRLEAAAEAVRKLFPYGARILDAGGFDGALALFLPKYDIYVIDPATTGGSVLSIPAKAGAYDLVLAIDVLEHINPTARERAIDEFVRVAIKAVVLNYPCTDSAPAQELMLKATNNELIREHVEWDLPDSDWVLDKMSERGFNGVVTPHASIAVWLGQHLALNLVPDVAKELNRFLVENHAHEPYSKALYHLVVCERA